MKGKFYWCVSITRSAAKCYELPAGKIDAGEAALIAAKREII